MTQQLVMLWPVDGHADRATLIAEATDHIDTIVRDHALTLLTSVYEFIAPDRAMGRRGWLLAYTGTVLGDSDQPLPLVLPPRQDLPAEFTRAVELSRTKGFALVLTRECGWRIEFPDTVFDCPMADDDLLAAV